MTYFFSDHLGSTSITANANGTLRSRTFYHPWGEVRYQTGALPTDYRVAPLERSGRGTYTGQYSYTDAFGLMYYREASLWGAQADTLIPGTGNPLAWDRYAYTLNNPLRYSDPSGHGACDGLHKVPECDDIDKNGDGIVGFPPWQEDPGYDPDSDSIPGWDEDSHLPDASRQEKAAKVWEWLCSTGGWWGSDCPNAKDLAAWLLWKEGGTLYDYLVNAKDTEQAAWIMITLFRHLFIDTS